MKSLFQTLDNEWFLKVNNSHSPFLDSFMLWVSNLIWWAPIYLAITFLLIPYFKSRNNQYITINTLLALVLIFFQAVICIEILSPLIDSIVPRIRPCQNTELSSFVHLVGDNCKDQFAFYVYRPSLAFAIASFFAFSFRGIYRWLKVSLFIWALIVSYSRIYIGVHYPSSVIVSDLLGIAIGFFTSKFYFYIKDEVLLV